MNLSVRTGDTVMVISGKDKGKTGKILKVIPETGRIYVEGINIVSKSKKPRSAQDKGGILKVEGKIDASNVMVVCPDCGDVIRVAHKIVETKDGKSKSITVGWEGFFNYFNYFSIHFNYYYLLFSASK